MWNSEKCLWPTCFLWGCRPGGNAVSTSLHVYVKTIDIILQYTQDNMYFVRNVIWMLWLQQCAASWRVLIFLCLFAPGKFPGSMHHGSSQTKKMNVFRENNFLVLSPSHNILHILAIVWCTVYSKCCFASAIVRICFSPSLIILNMLHAMKAWHWNIW